jgi:hypothetical protein
MPSTNHATLPATVDFRDIVEWYQRHCDDSWEHQHGIRLETLDNPGWLLTVDLVHTDLQGRTMPEIREGVAPQDHPVSPLWLHCFVADNRFQGACDPTQVARLFRIFHEFMRDQAP